MVFETKAEVSTSPDTPSAKKRSERIVLSWPNRITLARVLMIPLFVVAVLQVKTEQTYRYVAFVLFFITALSDAVDGYLARRLNQQTELGRLMDPLADKLLLMTAFVLCSSSIWPASERLPVWLPVIVITRDVFLVFGSALVLLINRKLKTGPTILGKATTAVQMTVILIALLGCFPWQILHAAAWITTALTVLSGIDYFYLGAKELS